MIHVVATYMRQLMLHCDQREKVFVFQKSIDFAIVHIFRSHIITHLFGQIGSLRHCAATLKTMSNYLVSTTCMFWFRHFFIGMQSNLIGIVLHYKVAEHKRNLGAILLVTSGFLICSIFLGALACEYSYLLPFFSGYQTQAIIATANCRIFWNN